MPNVNRFIGALFLAAAGLTAEIAPAGSVPRVAVFDFELLDMSLEGELKGANPEEHARLGRLSEQLRAWFRSGKHFEVVDIAKVAAQAKAANLQACGGCAGKFAEAVGADLAVTGVVNKISNLILSISIYIVDVKTRKPVGQATADLRSNTDISWSRSLDWLIRHRLAALLEAKKP